MIVFLSEQVFDAQSRSYQLWESKAASRPTSIRALLYSKRGEKKRTDNKGTRKQRNWQVRRRLSSCWAMGCFGSKQKISKVDLEYLKKHTRYDEATIKEWFKGFRVSFTFFIFFTSYFSLIFWQDATLFYSVDIW